MESLRIKGLRSLLDTGRIPIKPLTILVGENSSGKSTFVRSFPLLRQSIDSKTKGPILWYGPYVDFGLFEDALSIFSSDKRVSFTFEIKGKDLKLDLPISYIKKLGLSDESIISIEIAISGDNKDKSSRISELIISCDDTNSAKIIFNRQGKISEFISNNIHLNELVDSNKPISNEYSLSILPKIEFNEESDHFYSPLENRLVSKNLIKALDDRVAILARKGTNISKITPNLTKYKLVSVNDYIDLLKKSSHTATWRKRVSNLNPEALVLKEIHALVFAHKIPWIIFFLDHYLCSSFKNVNYIAPIRATAERYYRAQDLSLSEVDFQGKNLAMFIKSLSDTDKLEFSEWLLSHFGFELLAESKGGHLSLEIKYNSSPKTFNVTDMGFGFSQILPIITQLWFTSSNKGNSDNPYFFDNKNHYLVIEQPELHLHPRFQAKMIDVFAKTVSMTKAGNIEKNGNAISIIIETHSETIINHIGHLISTKKIDNDDTSIVIFNKKNPDEETTVSLSSYDKDGLLNDWPWGFFEANYL